MGARRGIDAELKARKPTTEEIAQKKLAKRSRRSFSNPVNKQPSVNSVAVTPMIEIETQAALADWFEKRIRATSPKKEMATAIIATFRDLLGRPRSATPDETSPLIRAADAPSEFLAKVDAQAAVDHLLIHASLRESTEEFFAYAEAHTHLALVLHPGFLCGFEALDAFSFADFERWLGERFDEINLEHPVAVVGRLQLNLYLHLEGETVFANFMPEARLVVAGPSERRLKKHLTPGDQYQSQMPRELMSMWPVPDLSRALEYVLEKGPQGYLDDHDASYVDCKTVDLVGPARHYHDRWARENYNYGRILAYGCPPHYSALQWLTEKAFVDDWAIGRRG